jgi:hypothetical protein
LFEVIDGDDADARCQMSMGRKENVLCQRLDLVEDSAWRLLGRRNEGPVLHHSGEVSGFLKRG